MWVELTPNPRATKQKLHTGLTALTPSPWNYAGLLLVSYLQCIHTFQVTKLTHKKSKSQIGAYEFFGMVHFGYTIIIVGVSEMRVRQLAREKSIECLVRREGASKEGMILETADARGCAR